MSQRPNDGGGGSRSASWRDVHVYDGGRFVELLAEHPVRPIEGGLIGVAYKGRVYVLLIDYTTTDFVDVNGPLDIVLELVENDYLERALQVPKPGGMLVSTLPQALPAAAESVAEKGIRVAGLIVEADRLGMTTLAALVSQGDLVPTVAATYPLSAAGRAQATKSDSGKTVLVTAGAGG